MRRQAEAIATIERWQRSGKSKLAFAREAGISITTFHRWFKFYREHAAVARASTAPAFVELGESPERSPRAPRAPASPRLRLELPDGLVVTVY
jgi:hypothetical protein